MVEVDPSGSMQEAFTQAAPQTQFRAKEGEYREELKVNKDMSLIGTGNMCIYNDAEAPVIKIESGVVYVKNVSFKQTSTNFPTVEILNGSVIFEKCSFYSRGADTISIRGGATVFLSECTVNGSDASALQCNGNAVVQCHKSVFQNSKSNGITLAGNSVTLLHHCEIKECDESAVYVANAARFYIASSKIVGVKIGVRSMSKADYQRITELDISQVKESCIVTGDTAIIDIYTSKFGDCSGPVLKCTKQSGIKMQGCQSAVRKTQFMCLEEDCRVESNSDVLSGAVEVKDQAHLVLLRDNCHGCSLALKGSCTAEIDNCDFALAEQNVVSAVDSTNLSIYSCSVRQSSGLYIRTKGKFVVEDSEFAGCDVAMDVGGAEGCTITSCYITKSKRFGIYLHSCRADVTQCRIEQNGFAAMEIVNSWARVERCTIMENAGGISVKDKSNVCFSNGLISRNRTFGALAEADTTLMISESQLSDQPERGLIVCGKVTMKKVKINNQGLIGVQVEGSKGLVIGDICDLVDNGCGILAANDGKVKLTNSTFTTNGVQLEAHTKVIASLTKVVMKNSRDGVGCYIHNAARLTLEDSLIEGDATCGLVAASHVALNKTHIQNCKDGIVFLAQSSGKVVNCVVDKNSNDGIRILNGTPSVTECIISNSGNYGVYVRGGDPVVQNNVLRDNARGNTILASD